MNEKELVRFSKLFSYVLRHHPEKLRLTLEKGGWVDVDLFLSRINFERKLELSKKDLEEVVIKNDKKRFTIKNNKIRSNQGHSILIEIDFEEKEPPQFLYHGTVKRFVDKILDEGLKRMGRHHVHLSIDIETATKVGMRRGKPLILKIKSGEMHKDGFKFYLSENGVWLTNNVSSKYLNIIEE